VQTTDREEHALYPADVSGSWGGPFGLAAHGPVRYNLNR
jgi:hypothetical protein